MEKSNIVLLIRLKSGEEVTLSLEEAKAFYEQLGTIFGGEKRVESYPVPCPNTYPLPNTPTPYPPHPWITGVSTAGSSSLEGEKKKKYVSTLKDGKYVWKDENGNSGTTDCELDKQESK